MLSLIREKKSNKKISMTEKEKMLNGDLYNSRDPELLKMYHNARKLIKQYNNLDSEDLKEREQILTALLAKIGIGVWIEAPFYCDYGPNISIGQNTFVNLNCMFLDNNYITIGKNGLIGPYVQIYTSVHPLNASERIVDVNNGSRYLTSSKPVTIGDNVWIGGNTVILPGVNIGNNVTVGAGSVVTKNIPDDVLAFGNPCAVRKNLKHDL
tara:strand:+ start:1446 stop:2075 length:630 start_codon:yes stop_codon:yes gene_type:complete